MYSGRSQIEIPYPAYDKREVIESEFDLPGNRGNNHEIDISGMYTDAQVHHHVPGS